MAEAEDSTLQVYKEEVMTADMKELIKEYLKEYLSVEVDIGYGHEWGGRQRVRVSLSLEGEEFTEYTDYLPRTDS